MNNSYINVYKDNPTAGATDGVLVSEGGSMTEPINVTLNAANSESKTIKLALRCQNGYINDGNAIVETQNDPLNHWALCLTQDGVFDTIITVSGDFSTNKTFWAKTSFSSSDSPGVEEGSSFKVTAPIVPS